MKFMRMRRNLVHGVIFVIGIASINSNLAQQIRLTDEFQDNICHNQHNYPLSYYILDCYINRDLSCRWHLLDFLYEIPSEIIQDSVDSYEYSQEYSADIIMASALISAFDHDDLSMYIDTDLILINAHKLIFFMKNIV